LSVVMSVGPCVGAGGLDEHPAIAATTSANSLLMPRFLRAQLGISNPPPVVKNSEFDIVS